MTTATENYRIDRHGYVPELWAGLIVTALYMWQKTPGIETIDDTVEYLLAVLMSLGSILCLAGACSGSARFFPRTPLVVSYVLELIGLPMIVAALGWYSFANFLNTDDTNLLLEVLGTGLGVCIQIGSLRMMVALVGELVALRKKK